MRKKCLLFLLCMMTTVVALAGKESQYILYEGFEDDTVPANWTQEYGSGMQVSWAVEQSGASLYPENAFKGNGLVALRNTTGQTQHFKTKLVTPVINLTDVFQPILVFSHAQMQYAGDVDALVVYYRTSESAKWVQVGMYENKTLGWKTDTIVLTAPTATYQLAFEGVDKMGRGIALDDIIVRPMPTCDDPSNISADGLTVNSATLRWNGSLDTDSFRIVLTTTMQTDVPNFTDVVKDEFVVADFEWQVDGLERNTRHYVYMQAYCGSSESEWAYATFTTKNLVDLPYSETFDMPYAQSTVSAVAYWTHGTSILKEDGEMALLPYVNQNTQNTSWYDYSYSKTTALIFGGSTSIGTVIPAGHYVYAATPEINTASVSTLQATFWGTCFRYVTEDCVNGLIVGVMTDPADFTTFEPVDTVYAKQLRAHEHFTVFFNNYKGEGKYIAFASNFYEKTNLFFLDDVVIEQQGDLKPITDVAISNYRGAGFDVNANLNGNAQVQLIITRDTLDAVKGTVFLDPLVLPADYVLVNETLSASQLPYSVNLPQNGRFVQVYMRATDGTNYGSYTVPTKVLVPMKMTEDILLTLEVKEGLDVWTPKMVKNFSNDTYTYPFPYEIISTPQNFYDNIAKYPYAYVGTMGNGHESCGRIQLGKYQSVEDATQEVVYEQPVGDYIALPEVDNLDDVYLSFYMLAYNNEHVSRVAVGMMTDPFDPTTFDTISVFEENEAKWQPFTATFDGYQGKGRFPAIMALTADNKGAAGSTGGSGGNFHWYNLSYQYVDDIVLAKRPSCMVPSNIMAEATDSELKISWAANGMTQWVVNIYADEAATVKLDSAVVTAPTCTFKVKPHTTYYYGVSAICGEELTEAYIYKVTTTCAPTEILPYIEDFESWEGGVMNTVTEPLCWVIPRYGDNSGYYPYVDASNNANRVHSGKAAWVSYSSSVTKPTQDLYAALPLMNDTLQELQIKFYAKPAGVAYVGDILYVGAMSDPNDIATFDTVAAVTLSTDQYTDYLVTFDKYEGDGKYIAFMIPAEKYNRGIYIDDIMVDYISDCAKVYGVEARNMSTSGASIYWTKGNASEWEVLLATETMTLGSIVEVDSTKVLAIEKTTTMPYQLTSCPTPNTPYYVYVRAICDENNKGEWSNPCAFETTCEAVSAGDFGIEQFAAATAIDCWSVGVRDGATSSNAPKVTSGKLVISNTATTDGAYAIMPTLDIDSINRLQISFDAHGGTTATYLRELTVGVITNPSDLSTFVKMVTLSLPLVSSNSANGDHYTVRFNDYVGDYNGYYGKRIMFLSESGSLQNYIYLDNLSIDTIGTCIEPLQVTALEANTNDLTIGWEKLPSNKYQVQLLDEAQTTVLVDTILTDTTAIKVEGLTMLTSYYAQVRQICSEADTSIWSTPALVQTVCPAQYPLPYSENFDGYANSTTSIKYQPDCWEVMHNYTGTTVANTPCVYSTAKVGSSGYGYNIYSSASQYAYIVLPKLEGKIGELMMSFDYRSNNSSNDQYFLICAATDVTCVDSIEATMTVIDTVNMPAYKDPNKVWYYYSGALSAYEGEGGNLVLVAKDVNQKTFIDNILIEKAPTCFRPIGLTAGEVTKTSVELSWTPMGKETAWDVQCVNLATGDTTITTVNATPTTITGLQHSTDYELNVRANCGNGDASDWSTTPVAVTTDYFVELADAKWSFDNPATYAQSPYSTAAQYKVEKGWTVGNDKSTSITYTPYTMFNSATERYAKSDSVAMRMYSYVSGTSTFYNASYASLPEINADLNGLQIRFQGRGVSTVPSKVNAADSIYKKVTSSALISEIKIGTTENPGDLSTFELITEYRFNNVTDLKTPVEGSHWEEVIVPLYGAKGKYITLMMDEDTTSIAYIDDVVVEVVSACPIPNFVKADVVKHNTVTFSWKSNMTQWEVQITEQGKDSIVDQTIVDATTWTSTKVEPYTYYQFKVRTVGENGEVSDWRTYNFQTPCVPVGHYEDYVYNFETNLYNVYEKGSTIYELPECWVEGKRIVGVAAQPSYTNRVMYNTSAIQYSRNRDGDNTKNAALRLYNYSSTYTDSYVILPEVSFKVDSMNLRFWARAAAFQTATNTNANRLNAANSNYQKSIVIGAVANLDDISTFVPLDTFTYSQSWTSNKNTFTTDDPSGNDYWEEVIIPLKEYQGKGNIMILYPSNGKTSYMYIDDLEIIPGEFCISASNLVATNVTSTSATLNWKVVGNDSVALQVATSVEFTAESLVLDTILDEANGQYQLANLDPSTTYYYQVQHICSAEQSADWTISSFNTLYAVRFYENFSKVQLRPDNWARAKDLPEDIFNGKKFNYNDDNISANWYRTTECVFAPAAMRTYTAKTYSNTENHWLLTPVIDLTYTDTVNTLMLSLQLGLSSNEGADVKPNPTAAGDKFLVAVSVDGGATWRAENTFWWSDVKEDNPVYAYSQITYEGKTFAVDMSKYIGKKVQLGFVSYSDKTNSKNYIYLANVSINGAEIDKYASTICQWTDYEDETFLIDAYELVTGETTVYENYVQAADVDKYTTLTLSVDNAVTTTFEATICEGEDYKLDNFDITAATASGVYKQKLQGANTCDSIVVLNLTVNPRIYNTTTQSICQGDYFEFNGVKYYTNTVQTDTLTSVVTGCDSIVTLYLTVNAMLEGIEEAHLCPGDYVEFGKFGQITEAGTYVDTVKNALMCDSAATLTVFVHDTVSTIVRAAICQGESYSKDVWVGLSAAGDYPSKQETVWGCDSVVTLHLMVAGADQTIYDKISVEELPYVLNGEELLPVGTPEGVYTKDVELTCGTMKAVITVGEATGVDNVFVNSLALAPNIVGVGQSTSILGNFSADAVLEVYQATGALVVRSNEVRTVPGMPTAGVYMVVVKSGDQLYQSMLIVQ